MAREPKVRQEDVDLALQVMSYHREDEAEQLGVQEVTVVQEGTAIIERSPWVIELALAFEEQYGQEEGEETTTRVLAYLLNGPQELH